MDQLTYTYQTNSNKLTIVSDAGNDTFGFKDDQTGTGTDTTIDYTYDVNGNLTTDSNKAITNISYNHLNLPVVVNFGSTNKIEYIYDATGVKLKKIVSTGTTTEYAGNYIYENGSLQFFHTPEGYVEPINASNYALLFRHTFQYKDHLGNIRLSYKDLNQNTGAISLSIVEEHNYYPFGLEHKGYNNVVNGTENNYKTYQGQEISKEFGYNMLEFKYRHYDPAVARFVSVDPLSAKYPYNSTYAFAENKVIMYNELEGLETGPAYWMVYTPTAKGAGVTPTTWNKLYERSEAPSQAEATITDLTPGLGDVKGFIETFTGVDLMTGEKLGWGSRILGLFMLSELRTIEKAGDVLKSGKWIDAGENMSDAASSFQKQITGVDASQSFKLNRVKFDGVTDSGVLLDAKSGMKNFVGKDGNFQKWFKGSDGLINQANRQLKAADGVKVQWHFENKSVMEATQNLFMKNNIEGIELIHTPRH